MKTIIIFLGCLLFTAIGIAQEGINYMAIINNTEGDIIANEMVTIQFIIFRADDGAAVFAETHSPTTTSKGLVSIVMGEGTPITGDLATVDWSRGTHFLNVQIDSGDGLVDLGQTSFKSVPYAYYAANAASKIDELSDGKSDFYGSSLFLGTEAGTNDDATDNQNVGVGYRALNSNTSGALNASIGYESLLLNTIGTSNTAVGYNALGSNTTGSNNIGIGYNAQVPNGSIDNQIRIGNSAISYAGIQVGWTITSDLRWKENIRELPYGLDMVMQFRPVDYTRKNNQNQTREMGFIAQDLKTVLTKMGYTEQGFLTEDNNGHLSVRYNDLIALLTKAVQEQQQLILSLEEHAKLKDSKYQELERRMDRLETIMNENNSY